MQGLFGYPNVGWNFRGVDYGTSNRKLFRWILLFLSPLFTHFRVFLNDTFLNDKLVLLLSICHYIANNAR